MKLAQLVPPLRKQAIASDRSGKRKKCPKKRKAQSEVGQLSQVPRRHVKGRDVDEQLESLVARGP